MAENYFDKFDSEDDNSQKNYFDKFDEPPTPEESGYVGGTVKSLARGVAGAVEFGGDYLESNDDYMRSGIDTASRDESELSPINKAGRFISEKSKAVKEHISKPNYGESEIKRSVFEGVESLPTSVALMAPGVVGGVVGGLGAAAATSYTGPGAVAVGLAGRAAGATAGTAVSSNVMYHSVKQQTLEELDELQKQGKLVDGVTQEQKMSVAEAAGHAEWQGEAPGNIVESLILSRLPAAKLLQGVLRPGLKQFGKNIAMSAPLEVAGESYTSYKQTDANNSILKPEYQASKTSAAVQAIGPTLVMTTLMNAFGVGAQRIRNSGLASALENPETPIKQRVDSINKVSKILHDTHGKKIAESFVKNARQSLGVDGASPYGLDLNDTSLIDGSVRPNAPQLPRTNTETDTQVDASPDVPGEPKGVIAKAVSKAPAVQPEPQEDISVDPQATNTGDDVPMGFGSLPQDKELKPISKAKEAALQEAYANPDVPTEKKQTDKKLPESHTLPDGRTIDHATGEVSQAVEDPEALYQQYSPSPPTTGKIAGNIAPGLSGKKAVAYVKARNEGLDHEGATTYANRSVVETKQKNSEKKQEAGKSEEGLQQDVDKVSGEPAVVAGEVEEDGKATREEKSTETVDSSASVGPNDIVRTKDSRGKAHYVKKNDLDNPKITILTRYKRGGGRFVNATGIHRDNIDPTGEKASKQWKGTQLFDGQNGKGYASVLQVKKVIKQYGQKVQDYEIREAEGRFFGTLKTTNGEVKDGIRSNVQKRDKRDIGRGTELDGQPQDVTRDGSGVETAGSTTEVSGERTRKTEKTSKGKEEKHDVGFRSGGTVQGEKQGVGGSRKNLTDAVNIVEHTTKKGKVLRGIVITDITLAEAKAIDKYTFKKDGGFFIREKHLETDAASVPTSSSQKVDLPAGDKQGQSVAKGITDKRKESGTGLDEQKPWKMSRENWLKSAKNGKLQKATGKRIAGEEKETTAIGQGEVNNYTDNDIAKFYHYSRSGNKDAYDWYMADAIFEKKDVDKTQLKDMGAMFYDRLGELYNGNIPKNVTQQLKLSNKPNQTTKTPQTSTESGVLAEELKPDKETKGKDSDYGNSNQLVSTTRADEIRAKLRAKLNNLNSGVDPEILSLGTELAVYHVEAGARKFAEFSKAMIKDLGEKAKPYMRSWYEGARYFPGLKNEGMSSAEEIENPSKVEVEPPETGKTGKSTTERDTIKVGGNENDTILTDSKDISQGEQPSRTGKTDKGRETSGVREGSKRTVRGSGTNDSRADDKNATGELPGQSSKPETSKDGSEGANKRRHEGVSAKPVDYHISDTDSLGAGGAAAKARQNIEAIRILKLIQKEKRPATAKEQEALVKYVGWGSSELANGIFPVKKWSHETRKSEPTYKKGWASNGKKLEKLLTKEEYADAKRSTLNAHYTSKEIIDGMYLALEQFGYKGGGRAIEPGSGVGHFVGLLPESMPGTQFTTVEMDSISAGIAEALYPNHDVRSQDYAKFKAPKNFFDFAIGNPPFDSVPVTTDKEYAKHKFALHDFFFAKTIDRVRPGGVMMLVTSRYTMDKVGDKARHYLGKRADFLGAIRLPQTAFKKNAETDVVTDVIFLQKREEGKAKGGIPWEKLKTIKAKDKNKKTHEFSINEYFVDNPDMVLGSHAAEGSMYSSNEYTVKPKQGEVGEHFAKAVQNLPKDIYEQIETVTDQEVAEVEFAPDIIKEGGFFLDDKGNVLQKEDGAGVPVPTAKGKKKSLFTDFITLKDAVRDVLYVQLSEKGSLKAAQNKLDKAYKNFVATHGPINKATKVTRTLKDGKESVSFRYPNFQPFSTDPDSYRVAAIEIYDTETGETKKADIFTQRVISPAVEPKVESLTDALHVSMYQVGKVDTKAIAEMMHVSEQEAIEGLGGAIYHDPDGRQWVTDDEYLSGNVKEKLANANDAAEVDKKYNRNVKALESVQPEDLPASRVTIALGMPIIDKKYIEKFASEVLEMDIAVSQAPITNDWKVVARSGQASATATNDYGTPRRNAADLLDHALNGKSVTVRDSDSTGKTWVNKTATETANAKLQKLKTKFNTWIWEDATRADDLLRRYNDEYNNTVKREYGGDHINVMTFPGLSSSIKPYDHQKRAAWRIIQSGNTYMAHSVGAGKTIASIIAGMEQKRLGIKKKPVWVVPNHMLKQFSSEFLETYPAAKILVADEQQFTAKNRNRFMGKVAVENWDAIIITHAAFKKIPMSAEFQAQFIEEQLEEVEVIMQEAKAEGEYAKTKQIERQKKTLQAQLEKIMSGDEKDKGVTFEETGIDQIYVDEAQEFRKLSFVTKKGDLKGVDPKGSQLAFDLYTKVQYLESQTPGRSLVLMSGTPVTNTLGEVFAIQRFLQGDKLKDLGIDYFDGWAATFGDTVTNIEATPAGTYKPVTRFAKFNNMAALSSMWAEIGDYVHAKDLHYITRPSVIGGSRNVVIGESSSVQKAYKKALGKRIEAIEARTGKPEKGQDIILSVITDGRHAAMDDKYIDATSPVRDDSKMTKMVGNVEKIWRDTADNKSTQMVFADLGMPGSLEKRGFSTYLHIKEELVKRGIPENEIVFMQDYKKSDQKIKLYKDLNAGKIRIIIGSSQSMGTGVNAQKRLIALHHFDPDSYLPSNIEQREGRIIRQGNTNEKVHLYAYVTRGSYDETMWQFLETKQRFIDQFLSGKVGDDSVSDIDGSSDGYAMAKAMSSDNPLILEMAGVENELNTLKSLYTGHLDSQRSLRFGKSKAQQQIETDDKLIKKIETALENLTDTKGKAFEMKVDGVQYSDRTKAGNAFVKRQLDMIGGKIRFNERVKLGDIAGFGIWGRNIGLKGSYSSKINVIDKESGLIVADFVGASEQELQETSPSGIVRQLENQTQGLERRLAMVKDGIEKSHGVVKAADERIGSKFEYQEALEGKQKRLEEIKDELGKQETNTENVDGVETVTVAIADGGNTGSGDVKKSVSVGELPKNQQADITAELSEEWNLGKMGIRNLVRKDLLEVVTPEQANSILAGVGGAKFSVSDRVTSPADYQDTLASVTKHTSVAYLTKQPGFDAAKNHGDIEAADRIAATVVKEERIEQIARNIPAGKRVVIVPVHQREGESGNALPVAYAHHLRSLLERKGFDASVFKDIVKDQGDHNTDAKAADRTRNKQGYDGKAPEKSSHIIVVDDTFTSGPTISALIDHIELQGVKVAQASTMASGRYQNWLRIPEGKIAKFLDKAGLTEVEFKHETGYPVTQLTGSEVQGYIFQGGKGIEGILRRFPKKRVRTDAQESGRTSQKALPVTPLTASLEAQQFTPEVKYSKDGRIEGFTVDGKIYLVDGNIRKGQAYETLLHEIGHAYLPQAFQGKQWDRIINSFDRFAKKKGYTGKAIRAAIARVPKDTKPEHVKEEQIMYYLTSQANSEQGLYRRVMAHIKQVLVDLGIPANILTPDDIVVIAKSYLNKAYNPEKENSLERAVKSSTIGQGVPLFQKAKTLMPKKYLDVAKKITDTANFKEWFGKSIVKSNGEPHILYHGTSHPQFLKANDYPWVFDTDREVNKSSSPLAGLGVFLGNDVIANAHSVGTEGTTHPFFVRIENPLVMTSDELEAKIQDVDSARALRKRSMELGGYDGIIIKDRGQVIAFDKNQLKSASDNTGEFSRTNPDVRFSKAFSQEVTDVAQGVFTHIKPEKEDMKIIEVGLSTPEYAFMKDPAAQRVLEAQLDRIDLKTDLENNILGENHKDKNGNLVEQGEFLTLSNKLLKSNKKAYQAANNYLVETDQTGKGFRLKHEMEEWFVKDPEGNVVESFTNDESGAAEQQAQKALILHESEKLTGEGYSKEAVRLVALSRKLTGNAFDLLIEDLRRIEQEAKEAGLPTPLLGEIDEAGRYGVYNGKKLITAFETQEDAAESLSNVAKVVAYAIYSKKGAIVKGDFTARDKAEAWAAKNDIDIRDNGVFRIKGKNKYAKLEIRKRTDEELRPLSIQEAIAQMGDLRGVFFPRLREPGAFVMVARKEGDNPIREHFDIPALDDKKGWTPARLMKSAINSVTPAGRRMKELTAKGYDVTLKKDDSVSEDVFDATKLTSSLDAIMQQAMSVADKNSSDQLEMGKQINSILTLQIADIFKARGYLSTRMGRTQEIWEGYETDMQKALVQYGRNLSAGIAKRETAQNMILAFTGKDYSWTDYKNELGDQADWDEYKKIVEKRRVDPGKQKILYGQVRNFIADVLRNEEYADRVMGTMKGLAAIKFLGFRISSAAINMTNMVQGVPATMSAHTDDSLLKAMNRVKNAATVYGKYRSGKGEVSKEDRDVFQDITSRGWDQAMYNMELASALRSKLGDKWAKFADASMFMFGAAEKANRATTIFAAYKAVENKHPAMLHDEVMRKAKHISDRAHGVYGKETLPAWARGSKNPLKLTYTFQKFSHNYMLNMLEMGFTKKDWKAASYMLLSPAILAGGGATLATPALVLMAQALGIGGDDPEEEFYKWAEETFGSDKMARHGLAGLAGVNFKGSLQMHNPMPTKLNEIFGAPQGVFNDIRKGGKHFMAGELYKGFESVVPTAFGNMSKALRESKEGVTTGSYSSVFYGDEPLKADTWDAVLRFLSFNPARLSGIREMQWSEKKVYKKYQDRRRKINSRIKKEWLQSAGNVSDKVWGEIWKDVARYNELVRGTGRRDISPITTKSVRLLIRRSIKAPKSEMLRDVA